MSSKEVQEVISEFNQFSNWEDRYRHLIALGKDLPKMSEQRKTEDNKVKGCQSQVWLHASESDGLITFESDSDAGIVKGIIAVLMKVYNKKTPAQILQTKPDFLEEIGLRKHLSMSRANGLSAILKQISLYALAIDTKLKMQRGAR